MARYIALLRAINLGSHNRVPMPELREHLAELGYTDIATVVASGNIVLSAAAKPAQLERDLKAQIAERFGVDTPVVVRTKAQLAKVVRDNPFPDAGGKELHVLFLAERCPAAAARVLGDLELDPEALVVSGREIYAHYANGMQKSPMGRALAKHVKGVATDRNWNTVLKLHDLA